MVVSVIPSREDGEESPAHVRWGFLAALGMTLCVIAGCAQKQSIVVGSKNFTESVLLGEIVAQKLEQAGCTVDRKLDLGGTVVCDTAVTSGALDVYPEYSGTALTAILHHPPSNDRNAVMNTVRADYARRGLKWEPALGFENTFAMIVRKADADRLGLHRISDLSRVTDRYRPGFGYEFVERPDGWGGLQRHYGLNFQVQPQTMDLGLTYRALASGQVDLIAGNSTDGLIDALGLVVLQDDKRFFPPYDAVLVWRAELAKKCRAAPSALASLSGHINEATMRKLNYSIDGEKKSPRDVAMYYLRQ